MNSSVLQLTQVNVLDHGKQYTVTISNIAGTETLSTSLYFAPEISQQPSHIATDANEQQSFSVNVTGFPEPSIRWQRKLTEEGDFENIPGQVETWIDFPSVSYSDAGYYQCIAESMINGQLRQAISTTVVLTGINITIGEASI